MTRPLPWIMREAAAIAATSSPSSAWWTRDLDERVAIARVLHVDHSWAISSATALVLG